MTEIQEQAASDILTLIRDQKVTVSGRLPSMQEIADIIARRYESILKQVKRERQAAKAMRDYLDEIAAASAPVTSGRTRAGVLVNRYDKAVAYGVLVERYDRAVKEEESER